MDIESMLCPDCGTYPSSLIVHYLSSKKHGKYYGVECRQCGDYWEEYPNAQDFFQNPEVDQDYE